MFRASMVIDPTTHRCDAPPERGWQHRVMAAGGEVCTVYLRPPGWHRPGQHISLGLNLHGTGANTVQQEALSGMTRRANADGFAVARPEAVADAIRGAPPAAPHHQTPTPGEIQITR